jgi:PEP-CTERM motif
MKSFLKFASVVLFLMSAPLLRADSVLFASSDSVHTFAFTLPPQPTPDQSGEDFTNIPFFFFNNVAVTTDGVATNQGVLFVDGAQRIEFADEWAVSSEGQVIFNHFSFGFFESDGKKIFSGPVGSPTFIPGSDDGLLFVPGQVNEPAATLHIETVAQTPEPDSFVLLGSGLLGFAGVIRRKLSR